MTVPKGGLPWIVKQSRVYSADSAQQPHVAIGWLEWLDETRYDDPKRVLRTAEAAVFSVQQEGLPRLLGIWASACRLLCRHEEAFLTLREAFRLARAGGDRLEEADLLLREASLVSSTSANYSTALNIVERAGALFARNGDMNGLGRALVKQGLFLIYLDRSTESEVAFESALALLDIANRRDRIASLQLLGLIAHKQGRPVDTLDFSKKAMSLASTRYEIGKLQWLNGCAYAELGQWAQADEAFLDAQKQLLKPSPVDAALSVCDHVRLLIRSNRIFDARQHISMMRRLMEPLANNVIASAAIRDLVRSEQEGRQLTLELIQRIAKRVEESRRTNARRL